MTRLKKWNWSCSCEKVLWAIGDLIIVVLCTFVGLKAKDGLQLEFEFFCIYHNHVISKYDCLVNIFLCFLDILESEEEFNKRTLLILWGVINEVKWNVYLIKGLGDLTCKLLFFLKSKCLRTFFSCIELKLEGIEPTLLEWKSNVLTVRR